MPHKMTTDTNHTTAATERQGRARATTPAPARATLRTSCGHGRPALSDHGQKIYEPIAPATPGTPCHPLPLPC
eukprot:2451566-Alexandrium_andersonii.AAC.1